MAKHTTPPIPIHHWFQDIKSVENLRDTLNNGSFKQAVAILKEVAGPSFGSLRTSDVDAQRLAWYAGYRDAFNDLEKLTKLPEDTRNNQQTLKEWTHINQNE